jgi:2-(3-amino-3-carboxypropyl)histidine synthase
VKQLLENEKGFNNISLPQAKPRSKGEVLGCTSPVLSDSGGGCVIFIGDGRFHIESSMIMNPHLTFY